MGTRRVLIVNSKGGCGKSTLSSNLASYYARLGEPTAILDLDRQISSLRWLQRRPDSVPEIKSLTGWESYRGDDTIKWIIMDPPAQIQRRDLVTLVARADAVVVPVLPSPIDIHAGADFIRDLLIYAKVRSSRKPIGVVANRVRANTFMYAELKKFLSTLNIPFITSLRDTQNYIHASLKGIGVFEMSSVAARDVEQWRPLLEWIDRSVGVQRYPVLTEKVPAHPPVLRTDPDPLPIVRGSR
jgi:chromosome partitioning protein